MSVQERDFSSFYLGDRSDHLADAVIHEIADGLQVNIGDDPTSDSMQELMGKAGTNKVLRANEEVTAIDRDEMVELVERSGIQRPLARSLWTPDKHATARTVDEIVVVGAVANWQDRAAELVAGSSVPVRALAGTRVMDTATEKSNPNVQAVYEGLGHYPTETEYAEQVIIPRLSIDGTATRLHAYDTQNGDELLRQMFDEDPSLLEKRLAVARVANAGVLMATQLRLIARAMNPGFDADPENPQLFVVTDTLPLARTDAEERDPAHFQKSATALRQVVLTAKKLMEIAA